MIFVAVGTFQDGFDELVQAAERAVLDLRLDGFAQIGAGSFLPAALRWTRFLPADEFRQHVGSATIVVCHGGMGILGDAMRAARPIIAVPRRGAISTAHPANDQWPLLQRLAELHPVRICERPTELTVALASLLTDAPQSVDYRLSSNIPTLVSNFLTSCSRT